MNIYHSNNNYLYYRLLIFLMSISSHLKLSLMKILYQNIVYIELVMVNLLVHFSLIKIIPLLLLHFYILHCISNNFFCNFFFYQQLFFYFFLFYHIVPCNLLYLMKLPVLPFPALQCITATLDLSAFNQESIDLHIKNIIFFTYIKYTFIGALK
jgi:hypothetical protein